MQTRVSSSGSRGARGAAAGPGFEASPILQRELLAVAEHNGPLTCLCCINPALFVSAPPSRLQKDAG